MKAIYHILLILSTLLIFSACKTDNQRNEAGSDEVLQEIQSSDPDIVDARQRAKEKIVPYKESGFAGSLARGYWHFDVVVKGTGMVDDFKGEWYQFLPDQSYHRGTYDEQKESGTWTYSDSTTRLTIIPNNPGLMPSEYRVMDASTSIICVGTPDFKNNDTQIRMVYAEGKPGGN